MWWEGPDLPDPLSILSPLWPVRRCVMRHWKEATNSFDCPIPSIPSSGKSVNCLANIECVATPPSTPPSSPPSANKHCKKLKRLQKDKKKEAKWEKKCSNA